MKRFLQTRGRLRIWGGSIPERPYRVLLSYGGRRRDGGDDTVVKDLRGRVMDKLSIQRQDTARVSGEEETRATSEYRCVTCHK